MSELTEVEPADLTMPFVSPIRTGSAWEWEIDLDLQDAETGEITPVDLSDADALLQLRRNPKDATALISLTDIDGITLDGHTVSVSLSSAITASLNPAPCHLVWDLKLRLPGGDWWTPVKGTVPVEIGVSR